MADITIPGSFSIPKFDGSFVGNPASPRYTITYTHNGNDMAGLFGIVGSAATISHLRVSANVTGTAAIGGAGAIAGWNDGLIENVTVLSSSNISGAHWVGGIVGRNGTDGRIQNSTVETGTTLLVTIMPASGIPFMGWVSGINDNPFSSAVIGNTIPPFAPFTAFLPLFLLDDDEEDLPAIKEPEEDEYPDIKKPEDTDEEDESSNIKEPEDNNQEDEKPNPNEPEENDQEDETNKEPDFPETSAPPVEDYFDLGDSGNESEKPYE